MLIFPHRGPKGLPTEEPLHRGNEIEVLDLGAEFLHALAGTLDRNNRWKVTRAEDELRVHDGKREHATRIGHSRPFRARR